MLLFIAWVASQSSGAGAAATNEPTPPVLARAPAADLPVYHRSANTLADAIHAKELRSSVLLETYLRRIERLNPKLNAVIALDIEGARRRAAEADVATDRGESWGRLHGLPITVKEFFATRTMPTTCGDPSFRGFQTDFDASAVQRLIDHGAIVFGKTNSPFHGGDWQSYNEIYGTTSNPWDLQRTPGGSSGGSAAAIAAGLSALDLASDGGGSIRVPAHFSGTYGHKPSFGLVPIDGHCPMLDFGDNYVVVAGPIARSPEDLELLIQTTVDPATFATLPSGRDALEEYRVAIWPDEPTIDTDRAVLESLRKVADALRAAGLRVDEARPRFTMARVRQTYASLTSMGLFGIAINPSAFDEQRSIRDDWDEFFRSYDVVLTPVFGVVAFAHDHSEPFEERTHLINGRARLYSEQIRWPAIASVAGLPATVAPAGFSVSGLPIGVQIIGPPMGDRTTIDFARRLRGLIGGFTPPPES